MTRGVPVTLLRAGAALLVAYGFVVTLWLSSHGSNPQPIAGIREWVNRPLGLGEDFGPLAVMVLLLCAGYTAGATGFVRTYLPVAVATVLAAGAVLAGLDIWTVPPEKSVTWANFFGNLTFASHLVADKTLLVPLAWVVGLQLVAGLVALDRRGWFAPAAALVAIAELCVMAANGVALDHLSRPLLFLPLVLFGHVVRRVHERALPWWAGLALGAGCAAAVAAVDRTFPDLQKWWYPVAATYAVLVFLVALLVSGRTAAAVAGLTVTRWLADRVEWLLVLGGVVGFAVLNALRREIPVPVGVVVGLVAVGLAADACHRLTNLRRRA